MDYCYDPNAPISLSSLSTDPPAVLDAQTQAEASAEAFVGCSAEIRFCPGGKVIYQDPKNNCEFPSCSNPGPNNENYVATATSTTITTSPPETVAAFDGSSYFCGYSLTQVNGNCANAKPCDLGLDMQCDGLEVCIGELVVADLLQLLLPLPCLQLQLPPPGNKHAMIYASTSYQVNSAHPVSTCPSVSRLPGGMRG